MKEANLRFAKLWDLEAFQTAQWDLHSLGLHSSEGNLNKTLRVSFITFFLTRFRLSFLTLSLWNVNSCQMRNLQMFKLDKISRDSETRILTFTHLSYSWAFQFQKNVQLSKFAQFQKMTNCQNVQNFKKWSIVKITQFLHF